MSLFGKKEEVKKEEVKNLDYYKSIIEEIIKAWNLDPNSLYNPEHNSWALVQGSANFWITLFNLDGVDYLEVSASICKMPTDNLIAFYRRLLELNDYYIGVKLSVKENQVWLLGQRECEGMDKGEAQRMIDNVRILADDLDNKLMDEFGATK